MSKSKNSRRGRRKARSTRACGEGKGCSHCNSNFTIAARRQRATGTGG